VGSNEREITEEDSKKTIRNRWLIGDVGTTTRGSTGKKNPWSATDRRFSLHGVWGSTEGYKVVLTNWVFDVGEDRGKGVLTNGKKKRKREKVVGIDRWFPGKFRSTIGGNGSKRGAFKHFKG